VRASALSFLARLPWLAVRQSDLRRELHGADRGAARGVVAIGWGAAHASNRLTFRGLPEPYHPAGRGGTLCRVLPPLRHGPDPQQCRREPRERFGGSVVRPSEDW